MNERKPRVFIGSSREAIPYANAVAKALEHANTEVNAWYAGVFQVNDYTMEALDRNLKSNDFGVFVFAPDDVALMRDKPVFITRDNTLFEMGLFWGRLGRKRVFGLLPKNIKTKSELLPDAEFHIMSDLSGLTLPYYDAGRSDGNLDAAVQTACSDIIYAIKRESLFVDPEQQDNRNRSVLQFFWDYLKGVNFLNEHDTYNAYSDAIRNSFIAPEGYRVTGAAVWRKADDYIKQVGGNVGRNREYHLNENELKSDDEQNIMVLESLQTNQFTFFNTPGIDVVSVLCYPLGKGHVLSVHISGREKLDDLDYADIVENNDLLLNTIRNMIGGLTI